MKAIELLKLLENFDEDYDVFISCDNPASLKWENEPLLDLEEAEYSDNENVIYLNCETVVSRVEHLQ